ncbi:MAG: hypothetical protein HC906_13955 [Bacteroidales bacterium]|nr:hypothetical protein [Bacteroidales bacterium]
MDRKIENKRNNKNYIWFFVFSIAAILLFSKIMFTGKKVTINVESEKITTAKVMLGNYQDYTSVIGIVEPMNTFFLSAGTEGQVEEIYCS